jgi:hypothetical protein
MKKELKKEQIDKKTLHRCDCNHFHETEEMETITLKIRKGKNCSLESVIATLFPQQVGTTKENVPVITGNEFTVNTTDGPIVVKTEAPAKPVIDPDYDLNNPNAKYIKTLTPEEKAAFLKESAIPMEFLARVNPMLKPGIGIPSGDPAFESRGAKEIRRV